MAETGDKLRREDALKLARKGAKEWNEWAKNNPGVTVDISDYDFTAGKTVFDDFVFPGDALFFRSIMTGTGFRNATFCGNVRFNNCTFGGDARFAYAKFLGPSQFNGAKFLGSISILNSQFAKVPDFRQTQTSHHVSLYSLELDAETEFKRRFGFKRAVAPDLADRLRRLKEFAIDAKDHQKELEFFALELRAKRFHETKYGALIFSYLYEWCSDFGRSVWRPFLSLGLTFIFFGFVYGLLAKWPAAALVNGLKLSGAMVVPFVASSGEPFKEARKGLFGTDVSPWIDALTYFEGTLGLAFIFLIGLALRNRFRI